MPTLYQLLWQLSKEKTDIKRLPKKWGGRKSPIEFLSFFFCFFLLEKGSSGHPIISRFFSSYRLGHSPELAGDSNLFPVWSMLQYPFQFIGFFTKSGSTICYYAYTMHFCNFVYHREHALHAIIFLISIFNQSDAMCYLTLVRKPREGPQLIWSRGAYRLCTTGVERLPGADTLRRSKMQELQMI